MSSVVERLHDPAQRVADWLKELCDTKEETSVAPQGGDRLG